ncbi:SDR family NAD(P)-dependent oxidoreductase [Sphingomonas oligoaromativorans]|uniref:SDR family NAD(P)-dependent oxidoreductase n=1 Tax=Sphingomonas oligoaromativorans TaxID=575322 RepID=UPI00142398E0|nr:NAD(P)-dependent dehydrogenase (short-subunit alcohol dehydrogenase family) [Sphingomonas oligoaromativorans]
MNIDGKRVLITGGSSGIGLEMARLLLTSGAKVAITGRRGDALADAVAQLGQGVVSIQGDVADAQVRSAMLSRVTEELGGLDILVNNAGGVRAGRLENTSESEIRQMIDVDLVAPILLTRETLPLLRASGDALIVNVSSSIALVGLPFYATYAAAKSGLAHFGESLRRELSGEGIGVLTVYPTATDTPMMQTSGLARDGGRETASVVAAHVIEAIRSGAIEVVRGDKERLAMVALNKADPATVDAAFVKQKDAIEAAARDHSAL